MEIEISLGEIVDKFTILTIKSAKVEDLEKRGNIVKEWKYLNLKVLEVDGLVDDELTTALLDINNQLWEVENNIRMCEAEMDFSIRFIDLARSVYRLNDERAQIKKEINLKYGSNFVEEKSYKNYN